MRIRSSNGRTLKLSDCAKKASVVRVGRLARTSENRLSLAKPNFSLFTIKYNGGVIEEHQPGYSGFWTANEQGSTRVRPM